MLLNSSLHNKLLELTFVFFPASLITMLDRQSSPYILFLMPISLPEILVCHPRLHCGRRLRSLEASLPLCTDPLRFFPIQPSFLHYGSALSLFVLITSSFISRIPPLTVFTIGSFTMVSNATAGSILMPLTVRFSRDSPVTAKLRTYVRLE